jgi:hypothetical protein
MEYRNLKKYVRKMVGTPERLENLYLVFNKQEWMRNIIFDWTEEEIDNADERGLIGTKHGVDCYLARHIPVNETPVCK